MSEKITIQKNSVQETLIIPLYSRKKCTELYPNIFQDQGSVDIINKLDYDFSTIDERMNSIMGRFGALEVATRQYDLACEVKSYLKDHPNASVVNLGCGLDRTGESCDNGTCKIYNLDLPDVIDTRNLLIPTNKRIRNIAVDLNDTSWFHEIDSSQGVVFVAAGVFYYFKEREIKKLFQAMKNHFPSCVLAFDTAGKRAVKIMVKKVIKNVGIDDVDAFFHVDDVKDIKVWLKDVSITSNGYMLGYHDLKDSSVSSSFRMMAKIADGFMKMKIVKIIF